VQDLKKLDVQKEAKAFRKEGKQNLSHTEWRTIKAMAPFSRYKTPCTIHLAVPLDAKLRPPLPDHVKLVHEPCPWKDRPPLPPTQPIQPKKRKQPDAKDNDEMVQAKKSASDSVNKFEKLDVFINEMMHLRSLTRGVSFPTKSNEFINRIADSAYELHKLMHNSFEDQKESEVNDVTKPHTPRSDVESPTLSEKISTGHGK
jgi:hypothetical protein